MGSGYSCDCPGGYQRIGQGHCFSTLNAVYSGDEIGDVPVYPIDPNPDTNKKLISTEGCFSCRVSEFLYLLIRWIFVRFRLKVNGRHRRNLRHRRHRDRSTPTDIGELLKNPKKLRRTRRSSEDDESGENTDEGPYVLTYKIENTKYRIGTKLFTLKPNMPMKVNKIHPYCVFSISPYIFIT